MTKAAELSMRISQKVCVIRSLGRYLCIVKRLHNSDPKPMTLKGNKYKMPISDDLKTKVIDSFVTRFKYK